MFDRLFLDHPRAVGESYLHHAGAAARIGVTMIGGGLACLVHAVVPGLCATTGSRTIRRLHTRLTGRVPRDAELLYEI